MAAAKKKVVVEEKVADDATSKLPLLFQPLTNDGDYPALVLYASSNDVQIGIERKTEKGTSIDGGYHSPKLDSIIRAIDKVLIGFKLSNTQRRNLKADEFLELLKEHHEYMENFMKGEVEKCHSKTR